MKSIEFFKKTDNDWCPNYPGDLVHISISETYEKTNPNQTNWDKCFIIFITGADDTNVSKTFPIDKENEVYTCLMDLLHKEFINFDNLKQMGFD